MGRLVDGDKRDELDNFDQSIRPSSLSEYVGQTDIKENLSVNRIKMFAQSTDSIKKVLCHEMVHAVMYRYDVDMSDYVEEIVADIIFNVEPERIITFRVPWVDDNGFVQVMGKMKRSNQEERN